MNKSTIGWSVGVVAALIAGIAIGGAGEGTEAAPKVIVHTPAPKPAVTVTATPEPLPAVTVTAAPPVPDGTLEPGAWLVPEEAKPGRYRTISDITDTCYVGQNKGEDIIDNDLSTTGRVIFTVQNIAGSEFEIGPGCGPMALVQ